MNCAFWRGIVWKVRVRVPSYRLMKRLRPVHPNYGFWNVCSQMCLAPPRGGIPNLNCSWIGVWLFIMPIRRYDFFFVFEKRERERKLMIINTMSVCQTWVWQPGSENTTSNIVLRLRWHEIFFPPCVLCSLFFVFGICRPWFTNEYYYLFSPFFCFILPFYRNRSGSGIIKFWPSNPRIPGRRPISGFVVGLP